MANDISDDSGPIPAEEVANAFVKQYYLVLHLTPQEAHKFYNDTSVMARQEVSDSTMKIVSTKKGINDHIISMDYKECTSQIHIVHAQSSLNEAVIVGVLGHFTKDNVTKSFTQTFLLAPQTSGNYYVMNDFLFYSDVKETVRSTASLVDDVPENAEAASVAQDPAPEPTHVPEMKTVNEIPKQSDQSDSKSVVAKSEPAAKPVSSKINVVPVPKPAATFQVDPLKKSYASMLAKEIEAGTPAPLVVRVNPRQQSSSDVTPLPKPASPPAKASAPTSNGAQGNINSPADAKSIHIRGLPYEITDQELIESFKKFGTVKERSIRIKRFEDGFCYAFLEFETAKSAHSAVETEIAVFRGKEAQIQYKKSSNQTNQGGNNRGRSPSARGYYNDNSRGRESGRATRGSPTGRYENRDQPRGSSRGRYENYQDQARGSSAGRNGDSYQRRVYQNGGEREFRRGGGN